MKLSESLQAVLNKTFEPSTMVEMKFKGKEIAFKTDEQGNPVLLFVGRKNELGQIKGERFIRTLTRDREGRIIKDHWDLKGKAS